MTPAHAHYEIFTGDDGKIYWRLKARGNGEILCRSSQGYETEEHACEGIDAAERASREAHEIRVEGEEE